MPGSINVKIDTVRLDQLDKQIPGRADKLVGELAFEMEADIKTNLSSNSPSEPGDPPGVDTGTLKNSIHAEKIADRLWRVVDGVLYGIFLEFGTRFMAARPFFTPSAQRMQQRITDKFKELFQ